VDNNVLNIITSVERRKVKIDNEMCELKNIDEFDLKDYLWMTNVGKKFQGFSVGKLTNKIVTELEKDVNRLIDMALIAPQETKNKLSFNHKQQIMTFFLSGIKTTKTNTENSNSSQDSKDSMEDPLETGSISQSGS